MSFISRLGGAVTGAVRGFVTGGPVGALTGAARGALGMGTATTPSIGTRNLPAVSTFAPGGFDTRTGLGPQLPSVPTPGFYHGTLSRLLPGGESGYSAAPPGYHLNKRYLAYYRGTQMGKQLKDPTQSPQVVNPVVKNRKMNPLNPRALHRAVARERAAVRLMSRVLRGTGYHIGRRGMGGKKRARR